MKFTFKSRALAVATACLLAMLGWYLWQQLPNRSSATVQPKVSATAVAPSALGTPQKNEQHTGVSVPTSPSTTAVATANTPPLDEASQLAKIPKGTFREVLLALEAPARSRALAKLARLQVPKEDFTSLNVSKSGDLFYACAIHGGHPLVNPTGQAAAIAPAPIPAADAAAPAAATAEPVAMAAAVPIATPPIRHSRPGAPNVLYLDFNGMTITGTRWNSDNGVASYVAKPYDTDGNPTTFSDYEQEEILKIWARVAEDYAPFNVDVTT
ncbi:MAG: hypothetical protein RL376_575, partial [Verrucomicrobiota bacterium]